MQQSRCALRALFLWVFLPGCFGSWISSEYGWLPQKEYVFAVQGQSLAGLPGLKDQYAGFVYRGELRVQSHSPRVLLVKMLNMNYTNIHEEVSEGWWKLPKAPKNRTKTFPLTTSTVVVKLTKSMSPELVMQAGLQDWEVNFLKGIVSNVLVFLGENSSSGQSSNRISQSQQDDDVFSVVEDSVTGRCPVIYEVSKRPAQLNPAPLSGVCTKQQLWTVTKNRNMSNCQILNEDHTHLPTTTWDCTPGGSNCGHFWTRASLTEMIGCGDKNKFVLLSSVSVFKINAQLHLQNSSEAVVNSNLNITLISMMDLRRRFDPPQNKQNIKTLLHTYSTNPPPEPNSRSCQENDSSSEDEDGSKKSRSGDIGGKMDPTDDSNKGKSGKNDVDNFRIKRAIRGKNMDKYKSKSNKNRNNDDAQNQQSSSESNRNGENSWNQRPKSKDNRNGNSWDQQPESNNRNNDNTGNDQSNSNENDDNSRSQRRSSKNNRNDGNSWNRQPKSNRNNENSESDQSNSNENDNSWSQRSNSKNNRNDGNSWNRQPKSNRNNENSESDQSNSNENDNSWSQRSNSNNNRNDDDSQNRRPNYNPGSLSKRKNKVSWQASSEEIDQPSEELQLEENWNISSKEAKSSPPHQPFNMFALAHRTTYDLTCLTPKLSETVADIASDLSDGNILPEKHTLNKISLAVDLCRNLPLDQLQTVSQEVFEIHSSSPNVIKNIQRAVFRDIMMMCGTHPALQMIKGWVERRQIEGEEAAQLIASLPTHIFSPNKYLVQDFLEMVQQIAEQQDDQLTTTAVLALTNLVRKACVDARARKLTFSSILRPVCDKDLASKVTQWLASKLKPQSPMARSYIQALGNVGSSQIIYILKGVALNPAFGTYLQTSAVYAMRYPMLRRDPVMSPLLLSLYHNYSLPASSRVAAVAMLIYSRPGLAVWQRLAISTWYDPSPAVSQFVASSIRTMAKSLDSVYYYDTKAARMVKGLARPSRVSLHQPYNHVTTWHTEDWERIILQQISWMRFHDLSNLYYRHSSRASGLSRTNIEATLQTSSPDGVWKALDEMMSLTDDKDRHRQSPNVDVKRTLQNIASSLNLQKRNMPDIQAEIHLKVDNMMERLLTVNKDNIKSWIKGGRKMASQMILDGKALTFQKADMSSLNIATTTEMGFPVEFSIRTPWVVNANVELNKTKDGIAVGVSFMYSSQLLASIGVMSVWDKTSHSAGAHVTNFIQAPALRATISGDRESGPLKVKTSYVDQTRVLYFAMQPYTSQQKIKLLQPVLLNSEANLVSLAEPMQIPLNWLRHYLNAVYTTEKSEKFNAMDYLMETRDVLGFPLLMPNLEARAFEAVMNPLNPAAINFSMSLASKSMGLLEMESHNNTIIGKLINALYKTDSDSQNPWINQNGSKNRNGTEDENSSDNPENASTTEDYDSVTENSKGEYKNDPKSDKKSEKASAENDNEQSSSEQKDKGKNGSSKGKKGKSSSKNNNEDDNEAGNKSTASSENNKNQSSESGDNNKGSNENKISSSEKENKNNKSTSEEEKNTKKSSSKGGKNQSSSDEDNDDDDDGMEKITSTVYATTFESVTGDFNASNIDPLANTVNGSSNSYLIEQILSKINSGKAIVFGMDLESTSPDTPKMSAYFSYATTYSQRATRYGLFFSKASSYLRITSAHLDPVDIAVDLKRRVSEDLQHNFYIDYDQKTSTKHLQASAKATLGLSRARLEQLKSSPDLETCGQNDTQHFDSAMDKKCQQLNALTKEIGFGNITVYYNNDANFIEKAANMYMSTARVMLPRTEEWEGEGTNSLTVMLDSDQRNELLDAYIATPDSGVFVRGFPLARLPFAPLTEWAMQDGATKEYCGLSSKRVHTFDGSEFQYKMKDGWHLVAKDCSGRYGMSIIAKSSSNNTMKVEVNINDEAVVSMEQEEGKKVAVNGKAETVDAAHALLLVTDNEGRTLASVVHTPDSELRMQAPATGLDLVYTGSSLIIRTGKSLQGRLCGLCGSYTNSGIEQFLMPRGSPANSPQDFASSYAMKIGA